MSIRVIPAYQVVAKFVKEIQGLSPDPAIDALEEKVRTYVRSLLTVVSPSFADLGQRSAVTQLGDPDLDPLVKALEELRTSSARAIAEQALVRCSETLPRPDLNTRILLLPGDGESRVLVSQMHGVLGLSLEDQAMLVFVWPVGDWQAWLAYTVTHEYTHLVRNHLFPRGVGGGKLIYLKTQEPETLMDAMIAEGVADSFAGELYPQCSPPWTDALHGEGEARTWRKVYRRLQAGDTTEIRRVLFGDNDRIPQWTGYTLGYRIAQGYLEAHPQARPANLVGLSSKAIFEGSSYAQKMEAHRQAKA